jgi:Rrf2 family transcriptional regulator, iron-sulfur cluster assembly transcription factor
MRLNTRGRYGIQLMTQLACHLTTPQPLGLRQIAGATGLPWRYLEQITRPLSKAGLLAGRPGRSGGYVLSRKPDRISLRDVIEAASGPICLTDCVDVPGTCVHSGSCTSRQVWLAVTDEIRAVLARYTLCDLAMRPCAGCREAAASAREHRSRGRRVPPARPAASERGRGRKGPRAPAEG